MLPASGLWSQIASALLNASSQADGSFEWSRAKVKQAGKGKQKLSRENLILKFIRVVLFITKMIMRDVNNGWLIRYTHANVASFFFIFVYALLYKLFIINSNLFFFIIDLC